MNQTPTLETRCLRHRVEKQIGEYCALCEAKRIAKGDFHQARKLFVSQRIKQPQNRRDFHLF